MDSMDLIVVESPTKARTLSRFLGSGYQVVASFGHVSDLPQSQLGVDVENKFEPIYVQTDKQKETVKAIKKLSVEASHIYLATDPDREGEAIAWHVAELLHSKSEARNSKIVRIEFHEITKNAIEQALSHPRKLDMQLVDAQQARRVLDRLVGYKLSPILWKKVRRGLSAGRVQSVAVRLIVEKERQIEAFKSQEYWDIEVELKGQAESFKAKLIEKNGEKLAIENQTQANQAETDLRAAKYQVASVEKKDFSRTPPAPFTTSTLQQTAANQLGWSAKKTMQVAQSLYEEGVITYHRTDSTNIAEEAIKSLQAYILFEYGPEYALPSPRVYKTKDKVAQEAHEAIRPTSVSEIPNSKSQDPNNNQIQNSKFSNREQERLYELIWKRFTATQMSDMTGQNTSVKITASGKPATYGLLAKGETISFIGWQKLYQKEVKAKELEPGEDEINKDEKVVLPELVEGQMLGFINLEAKQKFTQPPTRYNDAGLIKALEEMGIGRPSTYAPTISTILERQYVEKFEKRFKPTAIGIAVNDFLMANFANIFDYQFTANMEAELDEIATGERKWKAVMEEFYTPFAKELGLVADSAERVKIATEKTGEQCPTCGTGEVVVRVGKFGKFLSCSRYPECEYKANFQNKIGIKCPKCLNGDVIARKTKTGRTFFGCGNYPNCDYASWNKPNIDTKQKTDEAELAKDSVV